MISQLSDAQICTAVVPPHVPDPTGGTYHVLTNSVLIDSAGGDYYVCSGVTLEMNYSAGCNYLLEDGATLIINEHEGDNVQAKGNCTIIDYEAINELVVTMESTSTATKPNYTFGLFTFYCNPMIFDYSLVGGNSPCSTSLEETNNETKVVAFPNPANDFITIRSGSDGISSFQIVDAQGRVVYKGECDKKITIDIMDLDAGIYYLRLGSKTITISIER